MVEFNRENSQIIEIESMPDYSQQTTYYKPEKRERAGLKQNPAQEEIGYIIDSLEIIQQLYGDKQKRCRVELETENDYTDFLERLENEEIIGKGVKDLEWDVHYITEDDIFWGSAGTTTPLYQFEQEDISDEVKTFRIENKGEFKLTWNDKTVEEDAKYSQSYEKPSVSITSKSDELTENFEELYKAVSCEADPEDTLENIEDKLRSNAAPDPKEYLESDKINI